MKTSISGERLNGRRRRVTALARMAVVTTCLLATACVHRAQVWPSPLREGNQVTAKFDSPRAIGFGIDSLFVATELSGSVVAIRGDTLVVRLTDVPGQPGRRTWVGREAIVLLDSATTVTRAEFDQSSIALMAVAGIAFVYAFIGSLPP